MDVVMEVRLKILEALIDLELHDAVVSHEVVFGFNIIINQNSLFVYAGNLSKILDPHFPQQTETEANMIIIQKVNQELL